MATTWTPRTKPSTNWDIVLVGGKAIDYQDNYEYNSYVQYNGLIDTSWTSRTKPSTVWTARTKP